MLTNKPYQDFFAQWSPDGTTIVYVTSNNSEDIYLMAADGSNKCPLVTNPSNDFVPCWSPDGDYVAYQTSFGNNDDEIAIIEIATGGITRLTSSIGWDSLSTWK